MSRSIEIFSRGDIESISKEEARRMFNRRISKREREMDKLRLILIDLDRIGTKKREVKLKKK